MHMWHHVTNHLIIFTDKDSNSENRIKLRVRDTDRNNRVLAIATWSSGIDSGGQGPLLLQRFLA
jgi:hypothetical protein